MSSVFGSIRDYGAGFIRRFPPFVARTARGAADALWPNRCGACGAILAGGRGVVCQACRVETSAWFDLPYCGRCGRTLASSAIHPEGCARCRTEHYWNLAGVARVGVYTGRLPRLLVDLKLSGQVRNASYLGELLATAIQRQPWASAIDCLIPVPSHWLRRWQHGGEHTLLLAEETGRRLKLEVVRAVERVKAAASQTTLDSHARRLENVRGCFAPSQTGSIFRGRANRGHCLAGRTVCIIDNVLYTGATVREVAKVARQLGARAICAAVVCRPADFDDPPALVRLPDSLS